MKKDIKEKTPGANSDTTLIYYNYNRLHKKKMEQAYRFQTCPKK